LPISRGFIVSAILEFPPARLSRLVYYYPSIFFSRRDDFMPLKS
jgi:hypothetical protein